MLASVSGQSPAALFRALLGDDGNFLVRPIQALALALEFGVFGVHALPYHIVCTVVLGIVAILLYLVLVELRAGRLLAFAIALLFGLLPHYSTDRFFISSQQAVFCMGFALLGIYAFLRSVRPECRRAPGWVALGVLSAVLSFLAYEVALCLIAASLLIIGLRRYRELRTSPRLRLAGLVGLASAGAALLIIFVVKARLQTKIVYHHHLFKHFGALTWHAIDEALKFNFRTYLLHMPAALTALYRQSALTSTAFATAAVIAVLVAAFQWRSMRSCEIPDRRFCLWLIVAGSVLFGLGYGLFFPGLGVNFASAGLANRIEIASAPGASCVLVAIVGLACSLLRSSLARSRMFSLAMGLICGANSLAVSGIGFFWTEAALQQTAILRSVAVNVPPLPKGSVLLLDGFCRYDGPGVVFEAGLDSTGAIRLTSGDYSVAADVISSNLRFEDDAAVSTMYGEIVAHYPYGNKLFVYNFGRRLLAALPSKQAAADYLRAMNPTGDGGCPAAHEGDGVKLF